MVPDGAGLRKQPVLQGLIRNPVQNRNSPRYCKKDETGTSLEQMPRRGIPGRSGVGRIRVRRLAVRRDTTYCSVGAILLQRKSVFVHRIMVYTQAFVVFAGNGTDVCLGGIQWENIF